MGLIVYGHLASQPTRAVYWTCLLGGIPFTLGNANDGEMDLDTHGANPRQQVPAIDDEGFQLSEACAIAHYLSLKHDIAGLFPANLEHNAKVHQFLHMHHSLLRLATLRLMLVHLLKPLNRPPRAPNPLSIFQTDNVSISFGLEDPLTAGVDITHTISKFLEENYFSDETPYLVGVNRASAADIVCYTELGQLTYAGLFDFTPYPRLSRWLQAMRQVPYHDAVHGYNMALGDIATTPNTEDRLDKACELGTQALLETGLVTRK